MNQASQISPGPESDTRAIAKLFRSPTLETVKMVEDAIHRHSGELNKTQLFKKLPRKMLWRTFRTVLAYLEEINHILISKDGILVHIWDPIGAARHLKKRNLLHDS